VQPIYRHIFFFNLAFRNLSARYVPGDIKFEQIQQTCLIQKSGAMSWVQRLWEIIGQHLRSSNNPRLIAGTGQCAVIDIPRDGCLKECIQACCGRTPIRKLLVLCILGTDCPTTVSLSQRDSFAEAQFDNVKVNMDSADRSVVVAALQHMPPRVV
jgi:hypothetical protein